MIPKMIEMMITAGIAANVHLIMIATMRQNGISISAMRDAMRRGRRLNGHGLPSRLCPAAWLARLRVLATGFSEGAMRIVDLNSAPREEWRKGVLTRMRVSAKNGGTQLCLFEQWCEPGHGAPTHLHAVEEVLHVLEGEADVWVEEHARDADSPAS